MITGLKFNPLEDMPDDYVPAVWDGSHVGKRIVDAFGALAAMPVAALSRKSGIWPSYPYEFEDLIAQQEAEQRSPSLRRAAPTVEQITRMEAALYWPARYLFDQSQLMLAVNLLSRERSRGGDSMRLASRRGYTAIDWQRWHADGCTIIAKGLIRDRVTIF